MQMAFIHSVKHMQHLLAVRSLGCEEHSQAMYMDDTVIIYIYIYMYIYSII